MLPQIEMDDDILEGMEDLEEMPSYTYAIDMKKQRVTGSADDLFAIAQAINKILSTERYENAIYSTNYGIELQDLYGGDIEWVIPELEMRIKEALSVDKRITEVNDFEFDTPKRGVVHAKFTVETTKGTVESEMEVSI